MLLPLCILLIAPDAWLSKHTLSKDMITRAEVAAIPGEHVFLLQRGKQQLTALNADGSLRAALEIKGEGPGKNQRPSYVTVVKDLVYLVGYYQVNRYTLDLEIVDAISKPENVRIFSKLEDGWLGHTEPMPTEKNTGMLSLIWFSDDLHTRKTIRQWPSEAVRSKGQSGSFLKNEYNPVQDYTMSVCDPHNRVAYFKPSYINTVYVFSSEQRRIVNELRIKTEPVPYEPIYDKIFLKGLNSANIKRPHHLPLIFSMSSAANENLVLTTWRGELINVDVSSESLSPDDLDTLEANTRQLAKGKRLIAFTPEGEEINPGLIERNLSRVLWLDGEFAFVTVYNEHEDHYFIYRCPIARLEILFKGNPIAN